MRGHRPRLLRNVLLALAVPLTASAAAPSPPAAGAPVDSVFVRADRQLPARQGTLDRTRQG